MPMRAAGEPIPLPTAEALALDAPGAPPPLDIPRIEQKQDNWCWAAVSEMIFTYYDVPNAPTQCEMASYLFGGDCCSSPSSSSCDAPAWPDEILDNWSVYWEYYTTAKSYTKLESEITHTRPVIAYYKWTGGGEHVALVVGCSGGDVLVRDPARRFGGVGWITYNELLSAYGLGSWQGTYMNIARA